MLTGGDEKEDQPSRMQGARHVVDRLSQHLVSNALHDHYKQLQFKAMLVNELDTLN